jgi:uncharacterized protein YdeI (YjbR/CyaY-like superfamily)
MNSSVNWFFDKKTKWQEAYQELRDMILSTKLTEELKWGCPCYTLDKGNVVLIHGFKDYCALLFMKGAIMKDPKQVLIQQTENVQSARQIRFTSLEEVIKQKAVIKSYLKEAISVEKSGIKVEMKKTTEYKMPEEFETALNEIHDLKTAFYKLTPGRQRGYLLYFSSAKQAKTRNERIEKFIPKILDGKGIDD